MRRMTLSPEMKKRLKKLEDRAVNIAFWCCMAWLGWLLLLVTIFASFKIPTESMTPTLRPSRPERGKTVTLDGLHLYDVKRVLPLDEGVGYWLEGWSNGAWQPLKKGIPVDSVTLDFGEVPDYKLFLVYADTRMGRMQRPFVLTRQKPEYY